MNRARSTLASVVIGLAVMGAVACMALASLGGVTFDLGDGRVYSPVAEAQATRTAQLARDEAARRALDLETDRKAQGAAVLGQALMAVALGAGALVLAVGLSFGAAAWVMRRATSIYPNAQGQYPVMVSRGFGWVTYHDPSRGLGAGAVYRVPTAIDVAAQALALVRGQPAPRPALTTEYPGNGSEGAMVQVASQAAAIGLMAAATRPAGLLGGGQMVNRQEARELAQRAIGSGGAPMERMPEVRIIDDPDANARFVELLEAGS